MFTTLVTATYKLSRNGDFPNDGIVATKMIMALFENVNAENGAPGLIERYYGDILQLLWNELDYEVNQKANKHRELVSMVV